MFPLFLLQGKPLMTSRENHAKLAPLWIRAEDARNILDNPVDNCVVLGVSEEGAPQFAIDLSRYKRIDENLIYN